MPGEKQSLAGWGEGRAGLAETGKTGMMSWIARLAETGGIPCSIQQEEQRPRLSLPCKVMPGEEQSLAGWGEGKAGVAQGWLCKTG